ncbi:hypothetical protein HRI96_03290 [Treponema parvum]|uniref:Uncharacterized protein n=1 Tax=Treponema parvum TaxID=138851 RepID=A0A975EZJ8_9SPIR|nr:hypothetical protein [Treponema parvum]QTQ11304.1 hypothetical protein HRI96_03290 [Treponema parvum]
MEFKKIVLIFDTPALNTDIQTYSLEELLDLGYGVCILDASPFLLPEANRIVTAKQLSDKRFEPFICRTKKELEYHIRQDSKNACFIPMFNSYYDVRFVFKLFTKYKVFYGHVTTARTELELPKGMKIKREWKESRLNPFHLYKAVYNRIISKIIKYQKAKFLVLGGKNNEDLYINQTFHDSSTKIIRFHTFDYERFLISPRYNYNGKPYCVYLDQYFPFHPDIKTQLGFDFTDEDKKDFVNDMNKVFEHIRNKYNMDIIIAAHPRADYNNKKDLYPNTIIEYGMTSQLIKGASLVVANFSNSMFFAVMAYLPLILVNSSVIKKVHRLAIILQGFAELTGALVVEKASELPDKFEIPIHKEKYALLENNYFKSGENNGKSMWFNIMESI